tara:strand:+ start:2682 stop:3650 length:969 start_codon:yes stop_codon:yes gene_type:complete
MKDMIFNIQNDEDFEKLALDFFDYQIDYNPTYASYSELILKGKNPSSIYEIPFLPIELFKTKPIICKGREVEEIFLSSGTTSIQSKHFVSDLSIYKESFLKSFELFYGNISDYCILSLLPNYRERGGSSLIYMIDELISLSQHKNSGFFLNDYIKLNDTLIQNEKERKKTILFGVTSALIEFTKQFPQKLDNTIIIETGGSKGEKKEYLKEELHQILKHAFQLTCISSEYGMTELLSQSYSKCDGIFKSPPWKKIIIRDINDPLNIVGHNIIGGINIIDLANIYSCPFIASQDLGKTFKDNTFKISGRFESSDLRGCNLLIE